MSEASPIPAGTRIGHVHLKVSDLKRALDFYCGVLGFELVQRYGNDPRVQTSFPTHPLPDPTAFQQGMSMLLWKNTGEADGDSQATSTPIPGDAKET